MGISDKLETLASPGVSGSDIKSLNTPEDWRPRLDLDDSKGGFVVSKPHPVGEIPDTADVLKDFDLDPNSWTVTSLRRSRWQTYHGEWLESVRVNVTPSSLIIADTLDAEALIDEVKKWRPERGIKVATGNGAYVVAPSDQQIGKKANDAIAFRQRRFLLALSHWYFFISHAHCD
jgi:hypothetical protein